MRKSFVAILFSLVVLLAACGSNDQISEASLSTGTSSVNSETEISMGSNINTEPIPTHFQDSEVTIESFFEPYIVFFHEDYPAITITQLRWEFYEPSERDTFVIQGIDEEQHYTSKYIVLEEPKQMGTTVNPLTQELLENRGFPKTALDQTNILSLTEVEKIVNEKYEMEMTEIIFQNIYEEQLYIIIFRDANNRHYQIAMNPVTGEIVTEYFYSENRKD